MGVNMEVRRFKEGGKRPLRIKAWIFPLGRKEDIWERLIP